MAIYSIPIKYKWQELAKPLDDATIKVELVPSSTPGTADVYIATVAKNNYVMMGAVDSSVYQYVNIHLTNPGKQNVGDKIYLISQPDTTSNDIEYDYDPLYFYLTKCGGPETPPVSNFDSGSPERDVSIFTYDGQVFCATYDNC